MKKPTKKLKVKEKLKEIKIVSNGDDWDKLFINGELVYENHSVYVYDLKEYLAPFGIDVVYREVADE